MPAVLKTEFQQVQPDCVDFLPSLAIDLLDAAINNTPCPIHTLPDILLRIRMGAGHLYLVKRGNELMGVIYLAWVDCHYGKILNIAELGGRNIMLWKDDLRDFVRKLMVSNECKQMITLTRAGWGKLFPELKPQCTLYSATLTH